MYDFALLAWIRGSRHRPWGELFLTFGCETCYVHVDLWCIHNLLITSSPIRLLRQVRSAWPHLELSREVPTSFQGVCRDKSQKFSSAEPDATIINSRSYVQVLRLGDASDFFWSACLELLGSGTLKCPRLVRQTGFRWNELSVFRGLRAGTSSSCRAATTV
jgi:hypothetical protein